MLAATAGPSLGLKESKKSATSRELLGSREVAGGPRSLRDSRNVPRHSSLVSAQRGTRFERPTSERPTSNVQRFERQEDEILLTIFLGNGLDLLGQPLK